MRRGEAGSARSAGTQRASPPPAVTLPATSASGPGRRPTRTGRAPAAPSAAAVAAPMPLPAPVTMTTAPFSPSAWERLVAGRGEGGGAGPEEGAGAGPGEKGGVSPEDEVAGPGGGGAGAGTVGSGGADMWPPRG